MSQQLVFDLNVDNKAAIDSINTFFDAFDAGVKNASTALNKSFGEKDKVIGIKLEGGKAVAAEFDNLAATGNKVKKAAQVLNGEFGKTPRSIGESIKMLREMLSNTEKTKHKSEALTEEWKTLILLLREAKKAAKNLKINEGLERSITGANIAAGLALDAIRALGRGIAGLVGEGIEMEVLMIQLKGFTGSAEAASVAFDDFLKIAAATPFNVKQIADGARTMMGFGLSTADATKRIEQLAIVASATGGELGHMARNLGQIQANQRAYTRDLMQFANQGIPIYQVLADVIGVTTQQVREMAEEGEIGFSEVAAALDKMTEKGSAFQKIAEEMDRTLAARLEALQGEISATAGKFIQMFQALDEAMGGPVTNTMAAVIDSVKAIGEAFDYVRLNVESFTPILSGLIALFGVWTGLTIAQNLSTIATAFTLLRAKILSTTVAQKALNVATAFYKALEGNVAALALAFGTAAFAMAAFGTNTRSAAEAAKLLADQKERLDNETFDVSIDSAKLLAFALDDVIGKTKEQVEEQKKAYDQAKSNYDLQVAGMERALRYLKIKSNEESAVHQKNVEDLKDKIKLEEKANKEAVRTARKAHTEKMRMLNDELTKIGEKYNAELGKLDEQSEHAKRLEEIRRKEIEEKLKTKGLSEKETLELKEQLHQMDNNIKRREIMARQQAEEQAVQKKIAEEEKRREKELEEINEVQTERMNALKKQLETEEKAVADITAKYEEQANKVKEFKNQEIAAIFENEEAAISSLDRQIIKARELAKEMEVAYNKAKKARIEQEGTIDLEQSAISNQGTSMPTFASGGPISGGTTAVVNEYGKEAFLSAAGKLSMINAPSWGKWTAPSSGTVIPAHLTKQLDIPSGGINLNRGAGVNAGMASGGMAGMVRAIKSSMSGDNISNNVTIQSVNPTQAASDMLVNLNRVRRRRYS